MPQLLDHTRSKLEALLRTMEGLKAVDYPFTDSGDVLKTIEEHFVTLRTDLAEISTDTDESTSKNACRTALQAIGEYLPVLGFLSRSSDLEAPVELHGPLLRLTKRALGDNVKLVIFSEWNYSPFTFLFPELTKRGVVLVGMPRSESENALIASLAGHEIGHNIWHKENLQGRFEAEAQRIILDEMTKNFGRWKGPLELEKPEQLTDLLGLRYLERPLAWAVRQSEETFCDLIGLLIFREAYLYAFQYLLAPGDAVRRTYNYPDLRQRARVHVAAAAKSGITIPLDYEKGFDQARIEAPELATLYGEVADTACIALAEQLLSAAREVVDRKSLSSYSSERIAAAKNALKRAVPVTKAGGIENILIAAWQFLIEETAGFDATLPTAACDDKKLVLNELVLKSFEVFEIERKLAE